MPTYKNNTDKRITHYDMGYMEWAPGQEKSIKLFVPHELLGLTMISQEPYVLRDEPRGFGYTEMMIAPGAPTVYKLPYSETVAVSVFVLEGFVRMFVGDSAEPIAVDPNNNHVSDYPWGISAYLTFESDEETAVYVKCEPYTVRGTERRW